MFHMRRELYDQIETLAESIRKTEEYAAMKQAEEAGKSDAALARCEQEYNEIKEKLEQELSKNEKDFDLIGALVREMDDVSEQMKPMPAYQDIQQKRAEFEKMMQAVTDVLHSIVLPDIACSCHGDCGSCPGCGSR